MSNADALKMVILASPYSIYFRTASIPVAKKCAVYLFDKLVEFGFNRLMAKNFSKDDLELLGYTNIAEEDPSSASGKPWNIFTAEVVAGIQKIEHTFVYLHSSCTKQDATDLSKSLAVSNGFYVIKPNSLSLTEDTLRNIFGRTMVRLDVYEDLIWRKIKNIFHDYSKALGEEITTEEYYVTPRSEFSKSKDDRLDNTIISYLEGKADSGRIQVVSASAGVGKTTLSRYVVKYLAQNAPNTRRVIPAYVEASHWSKLPRGSVDDVWEIIDNSLSKFNLSITEKLFKHALKQGYLVFVFDGFDELCGQRESHFKAQEVLQWLIDIVKETDARIAITTRTLFWEKEVGEPAPEECVLQPLRPFETPQAKDFFDKFFKKDRASADRSVSLYKQLIRKSQRPKEKGGGRVQFVNLPLCVGMIARFVEAGGESSLPFGDEGTPFEQFLLQILEREQVRQNLKTSAKEQLRSFEEVAVYCVAREETTFSLEDLCGAGFDETDESRLHVHPFLQTEGNDKYKFSYAFLEAYLLASYLAKHISASESKSKDRSVRPVMERGANGKSYVIEHLAEMLGLDSLESLGKYHNSLGAHEVSRSFLFHVINAVIDESGEIKTSREKTDVFFKSIGGSKYENERQLENLFVIGTVNKLDFSGVTIRNSKFQDVTFKQCKADSRTVFENCRFSESLDFEKSGKKEWAQVQLENCDCELPTRIIWEEVRGFSTGDRKEHIKDALRLALEKFWHHGRLKETIRQQHWNTGSLGHSLYCKPILDAMLHHNLLSEKSISGVHEGGYRFDKSAIPDLQRYMDNRQLTGLIKDVYDELLQKHGQ